MQTLIVVGGGAAGFFCAVNAAQLHPDWQVIILEKSSKLLSKVKISGGGRCNVTHNCPEVDLLIKKYPRGKNFLKRAFHIFSPKDTIDWFRQRGVSLKIEPDGRMFPVSNTSQTIVDCLLEQANKYGVKILTQKPVEKIGVLENTFRVHTPQQTFDANYLCIATGGFPKLKQYDWLRSLRHTIEPPVPSLFTFNMLRDNITSLPGISVPHATVKVAGTKLVEKGPLLITHWGMSGPVVLQLSAWGATILAEKNYTFSILVNWTEDYNESSLRAHWQELRRQYARQQIGARNPFGLPARLWQYLVNKSGIDTTLCWDYLTSAQQNKLIQNITQDVYNVSGKTTFKEEFVTCGGIALAEIHPLTMESKLHPNLYFAGEIMNVDGITGGFNFQHAWSSGYIAAISMGKDKHH